MSKELFPPPPSIELRRWDVCKIQLIMIDINKNDDCDYKI